MNSYYHYDFEASLGDGEDLSGNADFDFEKFKRSQSGKHLAKARSLMDRYCDVDDPNLLSMWESIGVKCQIRETAGKRYLAFIPMHAYEQIDLKLPVVLVFRPVGLLAEAFYMDFIEFAAQGDCITLIYCDEDPEQNEVFVDMVNEILAEFPADPMRVYTTGHSHYGELALAFTRRHHQMIAGVMQEGDAPGIILNFYGATQDQIDLMSTYDMPLINAAGTTEFNGIFPINQDAPGMTEKTRQKFSRFPMTQKQRIDSWKRRLYAMRCPVSSDEEILAACGSKAVSQLGFPVDRSETVYLEGCECYIGDIKNIDGKYHFRTVAMENIPHTTVRAMHILCWSYIRRFARNLETGEVIELFI